MIMASKFAYDTKKMKLTKNMQDHVFEDDEHDEHDPEAIRSFAEGPFQVKNLHMTQKMENFKKSQNQQKRYWGPLKTITVPTDQIVDIYQWWGLVYIY